MSWIVGFCLGREGVGWGGRIIPVAFEGMGMVGKCWVS